MIQGYGVGSLSPRSLGSVLVAALWLAGGATAVAQPSPEWTEPFPPFRIAGNLYYVGSQGLASYLVTTPQGHILINSSLEASVPLIRASVEKLGFDFADVEILLISHAHFDHNAGSAAIKALTGAKYMVMEGDAAVVESGGKTDFQYGDVPGTLYAATAVDRVLHDGDEVKLGGAVLVAHLTPGHTQGCTTWTMTVEEAGDTPLDVVIVGSPNVNPGYRLVDNAAYPRIAEDYERTFRVLSELPCDIFLGAHGSYFDLEAKHARLESTAKSKPEGEGSGSPFIDPAGYKEYVADRERAFRAELAKQQTAVVTARTGPPELHVQGHRVVDPMDRAGYEREVARLAVRTDLVPLRSWPADLPGDAPVFLTSLSGRLITLALRGNEATGFVLLADRNADGSLDDPEVPLRKDGDGWVARFDVPNRTGVGVSPPVWIETRWESVPSPGDPEGRRVLLVAATNVRLGTVALAGRETQFAVIGEGGLYGRDRLEIFFDLDHDGRLDLEDRFSDERFDIDEKRVVVGRTAYEFAVDAAGDTLTLTRAVGRFSPRASLEVGSWAPDFALDDLSGRRRPLAEFRGRVVLLDFWAIGCAPCIWEMPELAALRRKYLDSGFEIVGIHVGPSVPEIATTCAAKGADWPQLVDGQLEVAALYRVDGYPTTFVLDREGRIRARRVRGPALEAALRAEVNR